MRAEWRLIAATHNLLKLHQHWMHRHRMTPTRGPAGRARQAANRQTFTRQPLADPAVSSKLPQSAESSSGDEPYRGDAIASEELPGESYPGIVRLPVVS